MPKGDQEGGFTGLVRLEGFGQAFCCIPLQTSNLGRGRPWVEVDGQGSGLDGWTWWATVVRQDERIGLRRGASCLRVTRPY
jgi:hypothetical protein